MPNTALSTNCMLNNFLSVITLHGEEQIRAKRGKAAWNSKKNPEFRHWPILPQTEWPWASLLTFTLEWVAISFSSAWKWKVKVKSLSCVWLLATPWTAAFQAPLSMGFSRWGAIAFSKVSGMLKGQWQYVGFRFSFGKYGRWPLNPHPALTWFIYTHTHTHKYSCP